MRITVRRLFRGGGLTGFPTFRLSLLASLLMLSLSALFPAAAAAGSGQEVVVTASASGEAVAERFGAASSHLKLFDPATM
ncbi:MAG: hypothetical protein SWK76_02150, partial [Actinomycetota bacterium]|nr:hypothetical protein [Actinomycetota bacterium]